MPVRIGLTQRVQIESARKERRDCLDQAWTRLLTEIGMLPIAIPNHIDEIENYIRELDIKGVILTGGNDLASLDGAVNAALERDRLENRLLTFCTGHNLPVLGVCRGMQMMVSHWGGELVEVDDHVATEHALLVQPNTKMPLTHRDYVNSYHRFGMRADAVGEPLEVAATSPDGFVEALFHKSVSQWGIMWHPERPPNDARDLEILKALFLP